MEKQYKQEGLYGSSTPSAELAASGSASKGRQRGKASKQSVSDPQILINRRAERMLQDLDKKMAKFFTPTLEELTATPSKDSTSSSEASHARPSAQRASELALWTKLRERYSSSVLESFRRSDLRLSSLKMLKVSQPMTVDALLKSLREPLMNWGMISNGCLLMQDISFPKEGRESTLSGIVVPSDKIGSQCFLSPYRKRKLFALDYMKKNCGFAPGDPNFKQALKIAKELCRSHQTMKGSDPDISDLLEKLRQRLSQLKASASSGTAGPSTPPQSSASA